jgi:hypothetical protein
MDVMRDKPVNGMTHEVDDLYMRAVFFKTFNGGRIVWQFRVMSTRFTFDLTALSILVERMVPFYSASIDFIIAEEARLLRRCHKKFSVVAQLIM